MMDSSPVLRQQSQNKIQNDHSRMKLHELNKMTADPKASNYLSVPHTSKRGVENQDPTSPHNVQKALRRLGISRLPVLAKSLHLQTPSDFTQSHKRWEENSLAGKAKRKKPCTKPVPFNLTQPKADRMVTQNQRRPVTATSRTGAPPTQPGKTGHPKTRPTTAKPTKTAPATHKVHSKSTVEYVAQLPIAQQLTEKKACLAIKDNGVSTHGVEKPHRAQISSVATSMSQPPKQKAHSSDFSLHESGQLSLSKPPNRFTVSSVGLSRNFLSCQNNTRTHQSSASIASAQSASSTEACLSHLDLLSLKDLSKTPHTVQPAQSALNTDLSSSTTGSGEAFCHDPTALHSILQNAGIGVKSSTQAYNYLPQRVSVMKSRQKPPAGPAKAVQFSPDPAALCSILKNEGLKAGGVQGVTPRNSVCPPGRGTSIYTAQRVPGTKSCNEAIAGPMGSAKAVQFSPDPAALGSILQNEGVKAGRTLGVTPRNSVCPSGRGTSIYTAQRVPVTKSRSEATAGPMVVTLDQSPGMKQTPQRVPNTRHQPMSMRKFLSSHRTPYAGSPRLKGLQGHSTEPETHKEEVVQRLFKETDQEEEQKQNRDPETLSDKLLDQASTTECHSNQKGGPGNYEDNKEELRNTVGQPFFQVPHRESVIFFSTGKKHLRPAGVWEQKGPEPLGQHGVSSAAKGIVPAQTDRPFGSETLPVSTNASDMTSQIIPSVLSQPTGVIVQKSAYLGSAVTLLRRRLPPLEELRLDEEVATYTSDPAPPSSSYPLRPRCGNPVAATLQDSTSFVPIINHPTTSGPTCPSPLRER